MKITLSFIFVFVLTLQNHCLAQAKYSFLKDSSLPKPILYCSFNTDSENLLFDAIKYHNYDDFLSLFNKIGSLELRESKSCTSLVSWAVIYMNDQVFNFLMSQGADYTSYDKWGNPACYCALYGRTEYLKILLEKGISPDTRTVYGNSLLDFATSEAKYETLKLLLKYKVRTDIKDEDGNTILDRAKKHKMDEVVKILEEAGAK